MEHGAYSKRQNQSERDKEVSKQAKKNNSEGLRYRKANRGACNDEATQSSQKQRHKQTTMAVDKNLDLRKNYVGSGTEKFSVAPKQHVNNHGHSFIQLTHLQLHFEFYLYLNLLINPSLLLLFCCQMKLLQFYCWVYNTTLLHHLLRREVMVEHGEEEKRENVWVWCWWQSFNRKKDSVIIIIRVRSFVCRRVNTSMHD